MSIAAIILAAGESSRFGAPKQLLTWEKDNLVNTVICTALAAGLSPVVVVLGAYAGQVQPTINQPVHVVINTSWAEGVSTSIRAGLEGLPDDVEGVLFLHADQPQVSVTLIDAILRLARQRMAIVKPLYLGRPGNPVFFPRASFEDLKTLREDAGGRQVMGQFRVLQLEWLDETMGWDADTPQDYARLRQAYGLGPITEDKI